MAATGWRGGHEALNRGVRRKVQERREMPPATHIEIRQAGPEDAAPIAVVLYESFVEFKVLYTEAAFAATTPSADQVVTRMIEGPVWIAVREAVIMGTVAAVIRSPEVYIRGMGVVPAARGSGAGSRLLRQVETWATSKESARLVLSTTPFLHSAIRLYEKSGFQRTDRGPHDLFGTPLFTMEKTISSQ
jgi:GNAT superfamily N-acetyltransferase